MALLHAVVPLDADDEIDAADACVEQAGDATANTLADALQKELNETYRGIVLLANEFGAAMERQEKVGLLDALTGLPNRSLFFDRLRQATELASREKAAVPILMMDLNRFKEVNDTLGHNIGDAILREVATRLSGVLRRSDTVARLGGDEFAMLLPSARDLEGAVAVVKKIIHEVESPMSVGDHLLDIGVSIGVAMFPQDGPDGATALYHADEAMYQAKRDGSGYEVFGSEQMQRPMRNALLAGQLRSAIRNDELLLHHQPKVDLRTGRIVGAEALVRWQHPELGLLQPDEFIVAAERTGVIKPLTLAVLGMALEQLNEWRRNDLAISLSVNISARALNDWELPEQVLELLQEWVIPAHELILEITETALMTNPERSLGVVNRLASLGVRISIDDFGSGYTSLAYLKKMPVQELKIDMSFVQNITKKSDDLAIVRSIIDLCKNLDLSVVAEGVESQDVLDVLTKLGCDTAQGFYLGRPVPSRQLAAMALQKNSYLKRNTSPFLVSA